MNTYTNQQVDVLVNGTPVKQYSHQGRTYVQATEGAEFEIRIKNGSHSRILAIPSVDGMSVITGTEATDESPGYIVNGYNSYLVRGFRTSNERVNAFKFSKKSESYAAKNESVNFDTSNCGVIGVRMWAEFIRHADYSTGRNWIVKLSDPYIEPNTWCCGLSDIRYGATTCYNMSANLGTIHTSMLRSVEPNSTPTYDMATAFSSKESIDNVVEADFQKGLFLGTFEIYYASRQSLESAGIITKTKEIHFPKAFSGFKFCKPPK